MRTMDSKREAQTKVTKQTTFVDPGSPDGDRTAVTAIRYTDNGMIILYSGGSMQEVQAFIDKYCSGEKAVEL
jgi:hypothetical protein